jgi:disulfide oxidoreductase YuzD
LPCKGAKFILQRLKSKYAFEVESINLNANNKLMIYEKYKLDNTMIPSVFIADKLVTYGKVKESDIKQELDKYLL